jgi:hypothetical protein
MDRGRVRNLKIAPCLTSHTFNESSNLMWVLDVFCPPTIIPPRDSCDGDRRKLEVIKDKTNDGKVGIYNHSKYVALQHYFNYVKIAFGVQQFFCT